MRSEQRLGLIASVGAGGNNNDIQLVESLVTSYISKPSCVILLTVACESEYQLLVCVTYHRHSAIQRILRTKELINSQKSTTLTESVPLVCRIFRG